MRVNIDDVSNYKSDNGFFSLTDDGDVANVNVLLDDMESLLIHNVHTVEVGNNYIDVDCLRKYNEPIDECPLCKAGKRASLKIVLFILHEGTIKFWVRGKTFLSKVKGLFKHTDDVAGSTWEIERIGKKKDTNTTYEFFKLKEKSKQSNGFEGMSVAEILEELDLDLPDVSMAIKKLSYEEMQEFIETGNLPDNNKQGNNKPLKAVRREALSAKSDNKKHSRKTSRVIEDEDEDEDIEDIAEEDEPIKSKRTKRSDNVSSKKAVNRNRKVSKHADDDIAEEDDDDEEDY